MDRFCTYLTVYSGNKLPPFYIGSTTIDKIIKGYCGSVLSKKYKNIWKLELKSNKNLFKTFIITTHENRDDAFKRELFFQKQLKVVTSNLYINMSYADKNGRFGGCYDDPVVRKKMSESGKNRPPITEETRKILSDLKRGELHPMFGRKHTEEARKKISLAQTGKKRKPHTEETKKKMSEVQRGRKPWNTGKKRAPFTEEHRRHISESQKIVNENRKNINSINTNKELS